MSSAAQSQAKRASFQDTVAILTDVVFPTFAKGVIVRRPWVVRLLEKLELERRAVRRLQTLRARHGDDPLLLKILGRGYAVILSPQQACDVLDRTPDPFSPASSEKQAALSHFEPHASLISRGAERNERRALNDRALQSDRSRPEATSAILDACDEEVTTMIADDAEITWAKFHRTWHRMVRRIVLGAPARDDTELTDQLAKLRSAGNWAFFRWRKEALLSDFQTRLHDHIVSAPPTSLAHSVSSARPEEAAVDQVTHWMFAYDAAAIASWRALALLASHPDAARQAEREARNRRGVPIEWHMLRAAFLEALRLWPTTPAILRETVRETRLGDILLSQGTGVLIYAPFFHRDAERISFADEFTPSIWSDGAAPKGLPFMPFSRGPGICPGRHIVLLTGSAVLAALLRRHQVELARPLPRPLPYTLDHTTLEFRLLPTTLSSHSCAK